eukprot:2613612-Pleurochrysis_carterae.AAC.2
MLHVPAQRADVCAHVTLHAGLCECEARMSWKRGCKHLSWRRNSASLESGSLRVPSSLHARSPCCP